MSGRRRLLKWGGAIVIGTATALMVAPGHRSVSLAAGVSALLAVLLFEMGSTAHRLARASDSLWGRVRAVPEPKVERPADLERLERRFGWGQYSAGDFNYRVRPVLRRLAEHRLRESHGLALDDDAARNVLTPELWDHVVSKQPPDEERVIRTADIALMVDEIERL